MSSPSLATRTMEAFWGLIDPYLFMGLSASFLPRTLKTIFLSGSPLTALRTLLSPSRFQDAWFSHFWSHVGPDIRENAGANVLPLLDGRTDKGRVVLEGEAPLREGLGGVVVEIGPGAGFWVDVFSDEKQIYVEGKEKRPDTARTPITHVYGVEPNASHHPALRRAVAAAGLQEIYEIVPVGIEELSSSPSSSSASSSKKKWDGNIEPGSVDCVVSILCLCSIPEPERNIREIYKLLRPGGRWYVYEHVRCEFSWYMRLHQRIVNFFWPTFIGGCTLCRPTEKSLRAAGPWTSINIGQPPAEPWYHTLPHVLGVFTK
ncbi:S-adenosyl-L-methionine-dependent methyltransferase [Xylariaceae sp. FL0255]|nr:S-adenosyl-L-methionine-dependent methyltransferase [Xylariaceae sp. FL0255]